MRVISFVAIAIIVGLACKSTEKTGFNDFKTKRDEARSSDTSERRRGAQSLTANCCFPEGVDPDGRIGLKATQFAACGEVGRLLVTEHENDVLDALIAGTNADCYRQFPASTLARLCTRSACSLSIRRRLVTMLADGDPAPEITTALLAQLVDSDEDMHTRVAIGLGDMGEPDLWPAIAALSSPDPIVRRTIARGFAYAVDVRHGGPLDLPAVLPALERATHDSDADVATSARIALREYRSWSGVSPEDMVARIERSTNREYDIRLLGVRRFSCRTEAAAMALERMSTGPRWEARAARAAIASRNARCPRLVE